jgi:hypothetical protein
MMNLHVKRKMSIMTLHQSGFSHFFKPSGLETPSNVNDEEEESKKQKLLQIKELFFEQSKVFADFEKAYYEWFDDRGAECLVTYWFIKKQFSSP